MFSVWKGMPRPAPFLPQGDAAAPLRSAAWPRVSWGAPNPKHRTAPWVLGSQKHGSRRDSALIPVPQVKWQPAAEAGAGGSLAGIETNEAALFSVTPRN